jgi:ATP-dependent protease ClpP protease subunit
MLRDNSILNKMDDEDEDDNPMFANPANLHLPYFQSTQTVRCIKAYLDENIREAKYYRNLIQVIESLGEGDVLHLSINTYGGHLDGAIALINAMQNTDATVHCTIDGVAASAGSLIALASPSVSVSPYASMMIHAASFGSFGKQSDVISHASFIDKKVKTLMRNIYKDFLTEQELNEVIVGKELWFDADEIVERLEKREKLVLARVKKEQQALKKAEKMLEKAIMDELAPEVLEQPATEVVEVKKAKNKK